MVFPTGGSSFHGFGRTRQALKQYDPGLAALLAEVYGDTGWRYTLPGVRTHLPHLQGFDPQDNPTFVGWPELVELYHEFGTDPESDGGGRWVNLEAHDPSSLPTLGRTVGPRSTSIGFVNFSQRDVLVYWAHRDGTVGGYWTRVTPGGVRPTPTEVNRLWVVRDANGNDIVAFRTEEKTGRAMIR